MSERNGRGQHGLGWTYCPACERIVVVTEARHIGVHWAEIGRRCPCSSTRVPDDHRMANNLADLLAARKDDRG